MHNLLWQEPKQRTSFSVKLSLRELDILEFFSLPQMSEDKTDKVKIKAAESFEHDKQNISWLKKGKLLRVISYCFVFRHFFFLKKI